MTATYISKVIVDLWQQDITLEWTGPEASNKKIGPFHCTPGAGVPRVNCDSVSSSKQGGTKCTPKGDFRVLQNNESHFSQFPSAKHIVRFQSTARGIALHYYPQTPEYPASNGCVRIQDEGIAAYIQKNVRVNSSLVSVREELRPSYTILRRGDQGADVRKLQRRLTEKNYPLVPDGDFGPNTESTLKKFQKTYNLEADGIFGPNTYHKLFG